MSGKVILDIETVGVDWDALEKDTQDYLLKYADTEQKVEETKRRLGLWAPLSKVVIIGLLNPVTNRAMILSENSPDKIPADGQHGDVYVSHFVGDEAAILKKFWELIPRYTQYITFNGKGFDCPFLMLRSLIQGITPSRNLDTKRFSISPHCDLLEVLTFFGAARKFTLQFWCQTLGIANPKAQFGDGSQVQEAYKAGKMKELIDYNLADLMATAQLYRMVEERLLSIWNKK
jgi:DNA polymerase elongation subunit (family B)